VIIIGANIINIGRSRWSSGLTRYDRSVLFSARRMVVRINLAVFNVTERYGREGSSTFAYDQTKKPSGMEEQKTEK
jgi:hypothetical protein